MKKNNLLNIYYAIREKKLLKEAGSVEMRYKEFQNSDLSFRDCRDLFLADTNEIAQYYWNNKEKYNHIGSIARSIDFDDWLTSYADNIESAINKIFDITSLTDGEELVTVYRGVELAEDDVQPDLKDPGMCWTFSRESAEDFVNQFDMANNPNTAPCIITAQFKVEDIDWAYSVACMIEEPEENEIRTFKEKRPVSIDYEVL